MAKGLDGKFLHYGIRKEDLELIRTLCEKHAKVERIEMNDEETEKIIAEAIALVK